MSLASGRRKFEPKKSQKLKGLPFFIIAASFGIFEKVDFQKSRRRASSPRGGQGRIIYRTGLGGRAARSRPWLPTPRPPSIKLVAVVIETRFDHGGLNRPPVLSRHLPRQIGAGKIAYPEDFFRGGPEGRPPRA